MSTAQLIERETRLIDSLSKLDSVVVAYSGGVDSSVLAYYARKILGERAQIVIAVSQSIAEDELDDARAQARKFNWKLIEVNTEEVANPEYRKNDGQRCYFCKGALFEAMDAIAKREGYINLAYGANVADLRDVRPGQRAADEYKVLSPLQQAE
ncbi:MAG: TIGR00268 family protein, partial [Leptolyngbya sp.]|nr:TIGR00268 family protein [Candidatus Melainabacteria bacterium]